MGDAVQASRSDARGKRRETRGDETDREGREVEGGRNQGRRVWTGREKEMHGGRGGSGHIRSCERDTGGCQGRTSLRAHSTEGARRHDQASSRCARSAAGKLHPEECSAGQECARPQSATARHHMGGGAQRKRSRRQKRRGWMEAGPMGKAERYRSGNVTVQTGTGGWSCADTSLLCRRAEGQSHARQWWRT